MLGFARGLLDNVHRVACAAFRSAGWPDVVWSPGARRCALVTIGWLGTVGEGAGEVQLGVRRLEGATGGLRGVPRAVPRSS